ncbi:unnamed protein product [Brachionus calyciflorus]|uniref:C-type lectin domain-containing protein n=1 Tax=Brachionus calyciflorus TaxID=104777 RepID=A0A814QV35_9BILA|nr:unnamed protein product [Brachionus calyciflorus]
MKIISFLLLSLCLLVNSQIDPDFFDLTTDDTELNVQQSISDTLTIPKCPENFIEYQNECLFISQEDKTWTEALLECQQLNSTLLIVPTKVIIDYSVQLFDQLGLDGNYYVGGNLSDSKWSWLNGKIIKSEGPWWRNCSSESINECLEINAIGLSPVPCENYTNKFICQKSAKVSVKSSSQNIDEECNEISKCQNGLSCINSQCKCQDGYNW